MNGLPLERNSHHAALSLGARKAVSRSSRSAGGQGRDQADRAEEHTPASLWPHYRLPSSFPHLDHTELCSLSQLCPVRDVMKRKRDCMAQKKPLKLQPRMAALALRMPCTQQPPWLCDPVCHCHSDQRSCCFRGGNGQGWWVTQM